MRSTKKLVTLVSVAMALVMVLLCAVIFISAEGTKTITTNVTEYLAAGTEQGEAYTDQTLKVGDKITVEAKIKSDDAITGIGAIGLNLEYDNAFKLVEESVVDAWKLTGSALEAPLDQHGDTSIAFGAESRYTLAASVDTLVHKVQLEVVGVPENKNTSGAAALDITYSVIGVDVFAEGSTSAQRITGFTATKATVNFQCAHTSWDTPYTYTWAQDHSTLTASRTCSACDYVYSENATVSSQKTDATCEDDETTVYTGTFTGNIFTTQVTDAIKTGDKLGHEWGNWTVEKGNEPTTEQKGKATRACANGDKCDAANTDKEAELPAYTVGGDSNYTYSVPTAATCSATGTGRYTYSKLSNEVSFDVELAIDSNNHNYGTPVYVWNNFDGKEVVTASEVTVTATRTCTHNAEHKETESQGVTANPTQDQTCEKPELSTLTTKTYNNTAFAEQKKENVVTKAALGHDWNGWSVTTAPSASAAGEATRTCKHANCDAADTLKKHTLPAYTEGQSDDNYTYAYSAPTCVAAGSKTYTYKHDDAGLNGLVAVTITLDIDTNAHTYGNWASINGAQHSRTCENGNCGHVETANHTFNEGACTCGYTFVKGDLDGDGDVDANDAVWLARAVADETKANYPILEDYCDFDNSDTVNVEDARYLLRHLFNQTGYPLN